MKIRPRLSSWKSGVEIVNNINKEDICHGSRNSPLAVGSADSNHHFACTLLSLNGPIKTVPRPPTAAAPNSRSRCRPLLSRRQWSNSLETFMSLGTIVLIILVIALLGGFSGIGGGPFYGTGYYGGGGLGLILIIVLILVLLGRF